MRSLTLRRERERYLNSIGKLSKRQLKARSLPNDEDSPWERHKRDRKRKWRRL